MEDGGGKEYYVCLSKNPIKFDPVSKLTNVFFDESNKQVVTVRSGGVTGVQVQGPREELCHSFRMPDKGSLALIKLSPAQNVLALQRTKTALLEFHNLKNEELDDVEYSQGSRNKNAVILEFFWSQSDEILMVTDQGVELFQVFSDRRCLKPLRNITISSNWHIWCSLTHMLLLASGPANANMQPVSFQQPGTINKLPKFQIDMPVTSSKGTLSKLDVTVAKLYCNICILVSRRPPRPPGSSASGSQVSVFTIHKTLQTTRKTHILNVEANGSFALSIVDNLILVHHQVLRSTLLFDTGAEVEGSDPAIIKSIIPPKPIQPCTVTLTGQEPFQCPMYSANWAIFQPNIIIDVKLGFLWHVEIDLPTFISMEPPPVKLVDLLLRRRPDTTLSLLLQVIEDITDPCKEAKTDLRVIAQIFDIINGAYRKQLNVLAQPHIGTPAGQSGNSPILTKDLGPEKIVIDQCLMYSHIFSKFPEKKCQDNYDGEFGIKVILEYIRSLSDSHIPVQELNELLITCLLQEEHGLSRLHHLLQYRVLADSKPLACSLLSLESIYPPALQLSLDMLKRLGNADDEIMEILLHKQLILPTIRYARSVGMIDQISARKFLEAAELTNNPTLFYSVFKFFEQRNQRLKGSSNFTKGELCDPFVEHFNRLFAQE